MKILDEDNTVQGIIENKTEASASQKSANAPLLLA